MTTEKGHKQFVVVETNSCPSGQKSMPLANEDLGSHAGYRVLLEKALVPTIRAGVFNGHALPEGGLAVLYDKNLMEASGYAAVLADLMEQDVYLVPCHADEADPKSRFRVDGVLEIKASGASEDPEIGSGGEWERDRWHSSRRQRDESKARVQAMGDESGSGFGSGFRSGSGSGS